jgi:hypothetical protein
VFGCLLFSLSFVLNQEEKEMIEENQVYMHKKRRTNYLIIGIGKIQTNKWLTDSDITQLKTIDVVQLTSVDKQEVVIYQSLSDNSFEVCPKEEFEDGRFEYVGQYPHPLKPNGEVS